ncbi:MAG TPA: DsbA family protein [Solirubrobacteraceae bacterium]|nr:DsbA family protein [Solirubrobacteraceae bacterium]
MQASRLAEHSIVRSFTIRGVPETTPRFFFAAMSPYSWLASERIGELLPQARWRGVLAGAVFQANERVPWSLGEDKALGMADCEARAAGYGLGTIRWPDPWPTSDLRAGRAMAYAESLGLLEPFALAAMRLAFLEGRNLEELETVIEAGRRVGIDPAVLAEAISEQRIKDALRAVTGEAIELGVYGVPTVAVGDQLFWGDDRLEEAVAAHQGLAGSP